MKKIRIGIIGVGLIGTKRAEALARISGVRIIAFADVDVLHATKIAGKYGAAAYQTWQELIARNDIDAVVIAVPNVLAAKIAIEALNHKKHVLLEKPFGINTKESRGILVAARKNKKMVKAGFNHRFHPAIAKAKRLFDSGAIGKTIFIRARYGHGGRIGMEKEWRFNKKISGGGELLDQGVHIIDLMRWFGGEFEKAYGVCDAKIWRSKIWKPIVEDNAFAILKNKNITASFHVSTTNWGNIFSFEVFGDKGYLAIEGLGGWYGVQTLRVGKRKPRFGDVTLKTFSFPDAWAVNWGTECKNFISAIRGIETLNGTGVDGLRANEIIEALYRSSRTHKEISIGLPGRK